MQLGHVAKRPTSEPSRDTTVAKAVHQHLPPGAYQCCRFKPKHHLSHPENYLFLLLKSILLGSVHLPKKLKEASPVPIQLFHILLFVWRFGFCHRMAVLPFLELDDMCCGYFHPEMVFRTVKTSGFPGYVTDILARKEPL